MRNSALILIGLLFAFQSAIAKAKPTPTPSVSPTDTTIATDSVTPTPTPVKKAHWIPWPPIREEARTITFSVNGAYYDDGDRRGSSFSFVDIKAIRKIDEYFVTGEGSIRFLSATSTTDDAKQIDLRTAKVTLAENWFSASVGRMDVSEMLTTTRFFGRYPLMGLRRVTGACLYLPVKFLVGIEDYRNVSSPPTALTFWYLPNIFGDTTANVSGTQSLFLAQARARFKVSKIQTVLLINYGKSKSDFFNYSSINGNGTFSTAAEFTVANNYTAYGEFGIQNTSMTSGTSAFTYGVSLKRLGTFGPFSIDDLIFEMQVPVSKDLNNPFTGGDAVFPELAVLPQSALYIKLKARIRGIFVEADITNNQNDFTFADLNRLNTNSINLPLPLGPGYESDSTQIPFRSNSYDKYAMLIRVGIQF